MNAEGQQSKRHAIRHPRVAPQVVAEDNRPPYWRQHACVFVCSCRLPSWRVRLPHSPDGRLIGRIRLPEVCGNVTFGGPKRNRLFMAAGQSLYAVYVNTQGAAPG